MRRLFVLFIALSMTLPAIAASRQGVNELDLTMSQSFQDSDGNPPIEASLGYYVTDNILVGGLVSFQQREWQGYWGHGSVWTLGAFGEYDFSMAGPLVPFVRVSTKMLSEEDKDSVLTIGAAPGLKYFLSETLAFSAQLSIEMATEAVFDYDRISETSGAGRKMGVSAAASVRFLFF